MFRDANGESVVNENKPGIVRSIALEFPREMPDARRAKRAGERAFRVRPNDSCSTSSESVVDPKSSLCHPSLH